MNSTQQFRGENDEVSSVLFRMKEEDGSFIRDVSIGKDGLSIVLAVDVQQVELDKFCTLILEILYTCFGTLGKTLKCLSNTVFYAEKKPLGNGCQMRQTLQLLMFVSNLFTEFDYNLLCLFCLILFTFLK